MAEYICSRCQLTAARLIPIEAATRLKFNIVQPSISLPNSLCEKCTSEIKSFVEQSSTVLMQVKSKEDSKNNLWKSRVGLLKRARALMTQKSYGAAIISYEKYIKLLEIVFEVAEHELRPELFKERMATKELTIITSVYWDLLRVYDTNEKYRSRMDVISQKLVQFAPFTPITFDIVKKAEQFKKHSRHPDVFKELVRNLMYQRNHCFIATSVFLNTKDNSMIKEFRDFRDRVLLQNFIGKRLVKFYYKFSPQWAYYLDKNECLKPIVRQLLKIIFRILPRS